MSRNLLLLASLAMAMGCSFGPAPRPAVNPYLTEFLSADDLDEAGDLRVKLKYLNAADTAAIRSVLAEWKDPQAVGNLLVYADLIPQDIREETLFRGLAEHNIAYYNLAAIVGCQEIKVEKLSDKDRQRFANDLLEKIRNTKDARGIRASLSVNRFIGEPDAPRVIALFEKADKTAWTNLRAWLFKLFKDRKTEAFTAVVQQSDLTRESKDRLIAEFKDWQGKPTDLYPLLWHIPNLQEFVAIPGK